MNLVKTSWERFSMQKPAGKAALFMIIILAQCCVCILPMMVMSLSSGAEMVGSSPSAVNIRPGLYQGIEEMLEVGFESARQMVAASLPQP